MTNRIQVARIKSEDELMEKFRDMHHILANMRKFQKIWQEKGGYETREKRKYWEDKADEFLKQFEEK